MKRFLSLVLGLVIAAIALPPLWYAVFPGAAAPPLPPPGTRAMLPGEVGVNVIESGTGPPVLLSHGLPGSAYDWRETTAALAARGFRALAYDRVGYGHSDPRTEGQYTPEQNARELVQLLEALDLREAIVVGWSYGGATAMSAALMDDSRMAGLVLVGTGGPDSDDAVPPGEPLVMRIFNSTAALRWRRAVPPVGIGLIRAVTDQAFSGGPQPDWWMPGTIANLARWDTVASYQGEIRGLSPETVGEFDVRKITVPTLLVHGDNDRLAPVAISRYLASRIPNSELLEVKNGSHMLPVTEPDLLADRIAALAAAP